MKILIALVTILSVHGSTAFAKSFSEKELINHASGQIVELASEGNLSLSNRILSPKFLCTQVGAVNSILEILEFTSFDHQTDVVGARISQMKDQSGELAVKCTGAFPYSSGEMSAKLHDLSILASELHRYTE